MPRGQRLVLVALAALAVYAVVHGKVLTQDRLLFFAALVPSIILHEVSHGVAALACGDDTAKRAGRITLNPLAHIDPLGSIVLPAILILTSGAAFGYAKPVPVNPRRMRSPRNHSVVTALAGPGTNIVLAVLAAGVLHLVGFNDTLASRFAFEFGFANVILAIFNLLPIPPLDGSAMIERVLPAAWWPRYMRVRQYGFALLFVAVFWLPLDRVFEPALRLWAHLLP
ncbi:MAG: hypothetical protein QOK43_1387 [Acidimicrobiaceae bacterium]|jgi:Zn-dependent protease|nr:hypothetical protein [Acidimicrobiaceae bacterium]MDQ1444130.1 hypothetical protein [Acidimicrobiaceae bacterium]